MKDRPERSSGQAASFNPETELSLPAEGVRPALPEQKFYGLLVEAINDGVALVDEKGRFRYVNRRCCEMWGYDREEIVGRPVTDFLAEKNHEVFLEQFSGQKEGRHQSLEVVWIGREGKQIWTSVSSIPILDQGERPTGSLTVITDITERKKAEMELKRSEANLKAIFNNSLQYFVLLDLDKKIQAFNRVARDRAKKFLGLDMREGDSMYKFVVEEVLEAFNRYFDQAAEGETVTEEAQLKSKENVNYWVEANLNPVWGEDDRVTGVCFSLIDINERKLAEEALRESERRYRSLVEHSPDAILVVAQAGHEIVFVNPAGVRLLGAEKEEEVVGRSFSEFIPGSEGGRGELREGLKSGRTLSLVEGKLVPKAGPVLDVEMAAIPFTYMEGPAVHLIIRDISQRKRAEEGLIRYQEELRLMASELSLSEEHERRRLAAELHDRLGATLSLAKIKLESMDTEAGPAAAEEFEQISGLIEKSLQDTRTLSWELSPPVLYELGLKAALEWLADEIRRRHGLEVEIQEDGQPRSLDDDVRGVLFRTVRELLLNVVKHARSSKALVSLAREGPMLRVEVTDQGRGFDTSILAEGFSRTGGFGLFSIKERLSHLGGRFRIVSRPGAGTRVILLAPLKAAEAEEGS